MFFEIFCEKNLKLKFHNKNKIWYNDSKFIQFKKNVYREYLKNIFFCFRVHLFVFKCHFDAKLLTLPKFIYFRIISANNSRIFFPKLCLRFFGRPLRFFNYCFWKFLEKLKMKFHNKYKIQYNDLEYFQLFKNVFLEYLNKKTNLFVSCPIKPYVMKCHFAAKL